MTRDIRLVEAQIEQQADGGGEQGSVLLSIASVAPIRETIAIDGEMHEMRSIYEFGVIARHEVTRDWNKYRDGLLRVSAGEVLTDDEAILADYALERILRLALPTVDLATWEGIESADKESLANLFFTLNAANEQARMTAAESRSQRSITGR